MADIVLVETVRREARTFLQYVSEAFPWANAAERNVVARIEAMARSESLATARLARWLQRRHAPIPPAEPYPMDYTNWNFVAFESLLPGLIEQHGQSLDDLKRDLAMTSDPEARALLDQLVTLKQANLNALREMATAAPVAVGH